jgi:indole-3-glycerol phosphate synthase
MTILDQIIASKKKEVKTLKEAIPLKQLLQSEFFKNPCISLKSRFSSPGSWGIIAEFKRKSPSRGVINGNIPVNEVTKAYFNAGAAAISVLTDNPYFGGSSDDLLCARVLNQCPLLRKDFIIDEYQIYESKAIGADVILLIAACLTPQHTIKLAKAAHSLGLEVLLEFHEMEELDHLNEHIDFAGVNNRNLRDFSVNINKSMQLVKKIPASICKISESGLNSADTIAGLYYNGFQGFLMGEAFMKNENPGLECEKLIKSVSAIIMR